MQAVGTKNRTSLHSIDGSAFKTRGSLSIGRGGHVRKRRRGSLSFGISNIETNASKFSKLLAFICLVLYIITMVLR